MNVFHLKNMISEISKNIIDNKDYLIELDQKIGDGDLGITMSTGFKAMTSYLESTEEKDLGTLFMSCSSTFNEAAPSSLGTILSFGMMGMAKELKGKLEANLDKMATALDKGLIVIMNRAKSKVGEKTILDSLYPAISVLKERKEDEKDVLMTLKESYEAAIKGSESTKKMRSVHGRAAYYGDKSIGLLDGGSVVGMLIFKGIYEYYSKLLQEQKEM